MDFCWDQPTHVGYLDIRSLAPSQRLVGTSLPAWASFPTKIPHDPVDAIVAAVGLWVAPTDGMNVRLHSWSFGVRVCL